MTGRTKVTAALLVAALAGAGGWYYFRPAPAGPLDELRAAARKNPQDAAVRIELARRLMALARADADKAARDEAALLFSSRETLDSPASVRKEKEIESLRNRVAANTEEATAALVKAIAINPAEPAGHVALTQLYLAIGNFRQVESTVAAARAAGHFSPDDDKTLRQALILARLNSGNIRGMELEANQLLALDKDNAIATLALARGDWVRQDTAAADEKITRIRARPPVDDAYTLEMLGSLLSDRNKAADGLPMLERAVFLSPEKSQFRYSLAQAYLRLGRPNDSMQQYLVNWRFDKNDPLAYVGMAQIYHLTGDDRSAEIKLGIATRISNDPQIRGRHARLLATSGDAGVRDLFRANEEIERAVDASKGQDLDLLRLQAKIAADLEHWDDALKAARAALALADKLGQTRAAGEIQNEISSYALSKHYDPTDFANGPPPSNSATEPDPIMAPINAVIPSTQP
jgi:predicted Zn-dependent protease